jgi:hypothetical protein
MNKITESLLADFRVESKLPSDIEIDVAFEHFAANLTLGVLVDGTIDTQDSVVGAKASPALMQLEL